MAREEGSVGASRCNSGDTGAASSDRRGRAALGGKKHDPLLYVALLSALEGLSLELLSGNATESEVARAKKVMHLLIERVLGA